MTKKLGILSSVLLSLGILLALNHYLIPISYLSPAFFAKVKPTLLPEGYYNQRACSSLKSYLKNKRVAIVGPAASFEGSEYGAEIDAHDIVIRVNSGVFNDPSFKKNFGERIDVLFSSFAPSGRGFLTTISETWNSSQYFVALNDLSGDIFDNFFSNDKAVRDLLHAIADKHIPFCSLSEHFFSEFKETYKFRVNTGIACLFFLISTDIKSLDIYGFDFYKSLYNRWLEQKVVDFFHLSSAEQLRGATRHNSKVHNQDLQQSFFENHIISDKRVTFYRPRK